MNWDPVRILSMVNLFSLRVFVFYEISIKIFRKADN